MRKLILLFTTTLHFSALDVVQAALPNKKLDFEVSQLSWSYHLNGYPTKRIENAYWATKDLPLHFRYLHAMLVTSFFAEREDQVKAARDWLDDYRCENILACSEEQSFLDGVMKSYALILKKNELKQLRKIQNRVDRWVKDFKGQLPSKTGICPPSADRKTWFGLAYQIYCPNFKTLTAQGDTKHLTTRSLQKLVSHMSKQVILSSSRELDFAHDGDIDCETPWTVMLKCEVGDKTPAYQLNCERSKSTTRVSCKEKKLD